jgi:hypothetical protein
MFNKLKKALGFGIESQSPDEAQPRLQTDAQKTKVKTVSNWASLQGWNYSKRPDGRGGYQIEGEVGGKRWRIESGKSSRDFIKGLELRGRAELGINDDTVVMVMNRQLKNELEKRAYAIYTDSVQTMVDPSLPEELRWLSIYEEVGWEELGDPFLNHYAILSDKRETAMNWLNRELLNALMEWPDMDAPAPKILMLLRGRAYLRMQYTQDDLPTLEHAIHVFSIACLQAQASFSVDLSL